jgi:hypothetical protein
MRFMASITSSSADHAVMQPVGDVLGRDAAGGAVLHQADIVDVGHLGAADALIDPAHDIAENALRVVLDLALDLLLAPVAEGSASGMSGCPSSMPRRAAFSASCTANTSTL